MSNDSNRAIDMEDILIALDQLSQTVEVMGSVIERLKRQLLSPQPNSAPDQQHNSTANVSSITKTTRARSVPRQAENPTPAKELLIH